MSRSDQDTMNGESWFPSDIRTAQPIRCEDSFGRKRLFIEIFADTDRSGLMRAWKGVLHYQKQLPGYKAKWGRAGETAQRKQIVTLFQQGLRPVDVYSQMVQGRNESVNTHEALKRLVYRIARERKVTANVT